MRRSYAVGWLLVAAAGVLIAYGRIAPAASAEGDPAIKWAASYEAALYAARKSGKPVMVDFGTEWCGFCKQMDQEVLPAAPLVALSRSFEAVKVDAEKRQDLADKFGINSFPTYLFIDARQQAFYKIQGYLPVDPFAVRVKRALAVYAARPEVNKLRNKRAAHQASGEELARLGFLLRQAGAGDEAQAVLAEAVKALPADSPARAGAELDRLALATRAGEPEGRTGLEAWLVANSSHSRRWEAQYEAGLAQANASDLRSAAQTLGDVARQDPHSEWGTMADYYAKLIEEMATQAPAGG